MVSCPVTTVRIGSSPVSRFIISELVDQDLFTNIKGKHVYSDIPLFLSQIIDFTLELNFGANSSNKLKSAITGFLALVFIQITFESFREYFWC